MIYNGLIHLIEKKCRRQGQRNVIEFYKELGMTPTETHRKLKINRSSQKCTDGYEETKQEKRGPPKEIDDNVVEIINGTIRDNRPRTQREMEEMLRFGKLSMHRILSENLRMQSVFPRRVPRLLNKEEK